MPAAMAVRFDAGVDMAGDPPKGSAGIRLLRLERRRLGFLQGIFAAEGEG
jgi:hypothetical protein